MIRVLQTLRGVASIAFLVLNTLFWFVPICVLGTLRRLFPAGSPGRLRHVFGVGLDASLSGWITCAAAMTHALGVAKPRVEFAPDSLGLRRDAWYLLIANHQSWADILVLVFAFRGRTPPLKFFTKRELIWLPFVGLGLWMLDYPLVRRHGRERLRANPALGEHDRQTVRTACRAILERPTSVLNFLEGTRFSVAKRNAQESPHSALLRPKVGGLALVCEGLGDRLAAVVDTTILYLGGAPGFWDYLCGRRPRINLHVRLLPPPRGDREALRKWVDGLWEEKDARLLASGFVAPDEAAGVS